MEMKNPSSLTRSKLFELNSGWNSIGSWFSPSMPNTAPKAANSTPSSKVTGTKAGQLNSGLPLITSG